MTLHRHEEYCLSACDAGSHVQTWSSIELQVNPEANCRAPRTDQCFQVPAMPRAIQYPLSTLVPCHGEEIHDLVASHSHGFRVGRYSTPSIPNIDS